MMVWRKKLKQRVYLETSVISYLTARPSRNLITAACQQLTLEWWNNAFDLWKLIDTLRELGEVPPLLTTPEELLEL